MSEADFERLSGFIHKEVGITLSGNKKILLESRLKSRLRALNLDGYERYLRFLFSPVGMDEELSHLIDAVTTNTTHFFREPLHFDYLVDLILPRWLEKHGYFKTMRLWSAGCSVGMEPYTLGIVLSEFVELHPEFTFFILATDVSARALNTAREGVYDKSKLVDMDPRLMEKYFRPCPEQGERRVRVSRELAGLVTFDRLNFMEDFSFRVRLDVIFCRNVIIYYDRETQERLLQKLCKQLAPDGHVVIGMSETLAGLDLPLKQVAPAVYMKI